jgi:hypothetical protein
MDIYLTKDGKSVGPFTPEELRKKLKAGEADPDESAWAAETGDWKRLELVLEQVETSGKNVDLRRFGAPEKPDDAAAASDEKPKPKKEKKKKEKAAPDPARSRSSKLQAPPGVPSADKKKKGKGPGPVRALPSGANRGGDGSRGGGDLSFLRWLALAAVLVFVFAVFMPWVAVTSDNGRTELNALNYVSAKAEKVELPGGGGAPKYFRGSKLILLAVGVVALVVGALSFFGALNPRGSNRLPVGLALGAAAAIAVFGVIQTRSIEGQFNRAMERTAAIEGGGGVGTVDFSLDSGLFIAMAALVLVAGFLLAPSGRGSSPIPFYILLALGLGLGGWGAKQLGSRGEEVLKDAFADLKEASEDVTKIAKEKAEEGIDLVKDKLDKGGSSSPAPSGGGGGDDPFQ